MLKRILIVSFITALFFQGARWRMDDFVDGEMWAGQAKYFETGNPKQYNAANAYGHPGGPLIEGTIITRRILNVTYDQALVIFLTAFNSVFIAGATTLSYILRKDMLWTVVVSATLSLSRIYGFATPPSAAAGALIAFLAFMTLYLYERKTEAKAHALILWGIAAGLAVATRIDIGIMAMFVFLLLLATVFTVKRCILLASVALGTFVVANPYMYFMPVQHARDLIYKVVYHYAEFTPSKLSLMTIVDVSLLASISVLASMLFLLLREKITSPFPARYILSLQILTLIVYALVLTSNYQAVRYFIPVILIWESLLPMYLFSLISQIQFTFAQTSVQSFRGQMYLKYFVSGILILYPVSILFYILLV